MLPSSSFLPPKPALRGLRPRAKLSYTILAMTDSTGRRDVLLGVLFGVIVGAAAGLTVGRIPRPVPVAAGGLGSASSHPSPPPPPAGRISFAEQGEDLVVAQLLYLQLGVKRPTYIDIGAHHPTHNNNTYLFYLLGSRGVLVEPNPYYADLLREARPEDRVVEAGVGPNVEDTLADYYVVRGGGQLNTFSKEQADELVRQRGPQVIVEVRKAKLINVNKLLAQYFPNGGPDFLSVDTEGLDLTILRSLDFDRFRPKVVCAETSEVEDGHINRDIMALMTTHDYSARGGSFVNTIFLDNHLMEKPLSPEKAAASGAPRAQTASDIGKRR